MSTALQPSLRRFWNIFLILVIMANVCQAFYFAEWPHEYARATYHLGWACVIELGRISK